MDAILLSHGGAGAPDEWRDGCQQANALAMPLLLESGDALEAVIVAARSLEDDPRFNAGTGARLRLDGSCQTDAALMDSRGRAGAVTCMTGVKNPIEVARHVLTSPHILIAGSDATAFARSRGVPIGNPITQGALEKLAETRERLQSGNLRASEAAWDEFKGTIGAVARAADGSFAVSVSTGGSPMMLPGRVGDSPILGAGFFAGPLGAICCTAAGERIMERLTAHRIYLGLERGEALSAVCQAEIEAFPADYSLGIIAVSKDQSFAAATGTMPCFEGI